MMPDIVARLAVIRESECIGCMKCIQACPVDAIIGTSKFMHTVMTSICIGCGLCVPPCPVDCIDMIDLPESAKKSQDQSKKRFENKNKRLEKERVKERASYLQSKQSKLKNKTMDERKAEIAEIIQRALKRAREGACEPCDK